jgi:hypothetical protein
MIRSSRRWLTASIALIALLVTGPGVALFEGLSTHHLNARSRTGAALETTNTEAGNCLLNTVGHHEKLLAPVEAPLCLVSQVSRPAGEPEPTLAHQLLVQPRGRSPPSVLA